MELFVCFIVIFLIIQVKLIIFLGLNHIYRPKYVHTAEPVPKCPLLNVLGHFFFVPLAEKRYLGMNRLLHRRKKKKKTEMALTGAILDSDLWRY